VRWDVGGHADGDAGGAVQQHMRQARRHDLRFLQRAVEVGRPVDRAVFEFGQQDLREAREPRLGVTHAATTWDRRASPSCLAVDQRITVAERLGHEHHGLVTGGVAVRMELAEHVTDGARRFLVFGCGVEAQFRHGVDDAPLHGFQTVADVRQCAIENDVHGIIQVRLFGEGRERQALDRSGAWARDRLRLAAFRRRFFFAPFSLGAVFLAISVSFRRFVSTPDSSD